MIVELFGELQNLLSELSVRQQDLPEEEAAALCDRIVEIEGRIASLPATTVEEALVKLQMLKADLEDNMGEDQAQSMDEVIDVLRSETLMRVTRTIH